MIEKKVQKIRFELLSPEMIRKMSTVRIITPDTYDDDGFPIDGGLMDLRLGVIDPGLRCKTCGCRMTTCPGHFGSIELVRPVLHVGYVKMSLTLLKTVCSKCGKLLIPPEKIKEYKDLLMFEEENQKQEDRTIEIIEKSKKATTCPHCGKKQGKIKLLKPTTLYEDDQRLFPSQIRERIERISDKDLDMLGINVKTTRPEWSILTVLPVSPSTTRPSITLENGERSEDDITHKLVDVLRINQRLADNISAGAPQLIIEDLWDLLQYHVTTYFNNEVSGIPPARHRTGRPLKTLFQRLKGKEGRFRYNLSGKRVNFSARTVISPDPSLSINEVGVPRQIAEELTLPIKVTEWNLEIMKKYVTSVEYPKANYVIRPDGRKKKVTELNKEEISDELAPGYIVERQLIDGDISIFNRQPSLHRVSMMGHKVKVIDGKTFKINDAVSIPYNADYDGDEMNLHIPQKEEAIIEVKKLMMAENHVISIRNGKPIIHGQLDHITGAYLLTEKNAKFDKETAEAIINAGGFEKLPKPSRGGYIGKDLFSLLIPKNINMEYRSNLCRKCGTCDKDKCEFNAYVKIKDGEIISGAMEKMAITGELVGKIARENGPEVVRDFIDRSTRMGLAAIMARGYSVGFADYYISESAQKECATVLSKVERDVDSLIENYRAGKLERVPGKTIEETLEDKIMGELAKARNHCGRIVEKDLGPENHAVLMSRVGAKGNILNLIQMTACIGQTSLRGKRIARGYRNKALPHFKEGDISAKARGFIRSCLVEGLRPEEYFFHSMSGRDSLVDKGINTARSGYMQRRIINALLDIYSKEDGTVRDSSGSIVQFEYGEDGVNPQRIEAGKLFTADEDIKDE
ncbi:MAG: DNA-directed RNA polymerase subunit A' [Candidatus Micrarchaeota archaeon]